VMVASNKNSKHVLKRW